MTITRQSLLERFQLLSDEELLALFRSGDLIELAKDVATQELRQRGVDLSKPAAALPADSEDASGSGDEGTSVSGDSRAGRAVVYCDGGAHAAKPPRGRRRAGRRRRRAHRSSQSISDDGGRRRARSRPGVSMPSAPARSHGRSSAATTPWMTRRAANNLSVQRRCGPGPSSPGEATEPAAPAFNQSASLCRGQPSAAGARVPTPSRESRRGARRCPRSCATPDASDGCRRRDGGCRRA